MFRRRIKTQTREIEGRGARGKGVREGYLKRKRERESEERPASSESIDRK